MQWEGAIDAGTIRGQEGACFRNRTSNFVLRSFKTKVIKINHFNNENKMNFGLHTTISYILKCFSKTGAQRLKNDFRAQPQQSIARLTAPQLQISKSSSNYRTSDHIWPKSKLVFQCVLCFYQLIAARRCSFDRQATAIL